MKRWLWFPTERDWQKREDRPRTPGQGEYKTKIVFAFCSPTCYLAPRCFQQVHHERFFEQCFKLFGVFGERREISRFARNDGIAYGTSGWCAEKKSRRLKKKDGAKMNRVVSSTLRYVPGQGRCAFPARNPDQSTAWRSPLKGYHRPSFLLSSTEV